MTLSLLFTNLPKMKIGSLSVGRPTLDILVTVYLQQWRNLPVQ